MADTGRGADVAKCTQTCPDCGGFKANKVATRCRDCHLKTRTRGLCSVPGCSDLHRAKGYCWFHYDRMKRGVSLTAYKRGSSAFERGVTACPVDGCELLTFSGRTGLCTLHHDRVTRTGEIGPAHRLVARKGEAKHGVWHKNHYGYIVRRAIVDGKSTWVAQHRAVMEEALNRKLERWENVHHINGVRHDNRLENLELWITFQPAGQRAEDQVEWAKTILARYEPAALTAPVQLTLA